MKSDIIDRSDIQKVVNLFYDKVKSDKQIGYFFTDIVKVNWEKHLPIMYDFWENVLFYTGNYSGSPMIKHHQINQLSPIKEEHFNRWTFLFLETIDDLYVGENASLLKSKAESIAAVMRMKVCKD